MPCAGAAPMRILQLMHVNGFTREQVASHLQVILAVAIMLCPWPESALQSTMHLRVCVLHLKIVPEPCPNTLSCGVYAFSAPLSEFSLALSM